jgi:hypothetical protein
MSDESIPSWRGEKRSVCLRPGAVIADTSYAQLVAAVVTIASVLDRQLTNVAHVGFEQAPIGPKERAQFFPLRAADRLPPAEQAPALPPAKPAHHWAGPKELVPPHLVDRRARML